MWTRYVDGVYRESAGRTRQVPGGRVVADDSQRWGAAAFHYAGSLYDWVGGGLEISLAPRCLAPAL